MQNYKAELIKIPVEWAKPETPNLKAARDSAIWPDATIEQLQDKEQLTARLPSLLAEFKKAVESIGMEY